MAEPASVISLPIVRAKRIVHGQAGLGLLKVFAASNQFLLISSASSGHARLQQRFRLLGLWVALLST